MSIADQIATLVFIGIPLMVFGIAVGMLLGGGYKWKR